MRFLLENFIDFPILWHILLDYLNNNDDFIDTKLARDNDESIKNCKSIRKYF